MGSSYPFALDSVVETGPCAMCSVRETPTTDPAATQLCVVGTDPRATCHETRPMGLLLAPLHCYTGAADDAPVAHTRVPFPQGATAPHRTAPHPLHRATCPRTLMIPRVRFPQVITAPTPPSPSGSTPASGPVLVLDQSALLSAYGAAASRITSFPDGSEEVGGCTVAVPYMPYMRLHAYTSFHVQVGA